MWCDVRMLLGNMTEIRVVVLFNQDVVSEMPMNVSSLLTRLELQYTGLQGRLPSTIFDIPNLQTLSVARNDALEGSFPDDFNRSNVLSMEELDLSDTRFSGRLPNSFGFMRNLKNLDLSGCRFSGHIPVSMTNMSKLSTLDISSNNLTGPFPSTPGTGLEELYKMDLSENSIQGMIPSWLFSLPSLNKLSLSLNRFTGSIGKISSNSLGSLDLGYNQLNVEFESFQNLTKLRGLILSYNTLTEHDVVNITLPALRSLAMSSCGITKFPNFLRRIPKLGYLDLSNNKIHGPIPEWFSSIQFEDIYHLNLSSNFLTHAQHLPSQRLVYLDLHSNLLRGTIPSSICNNPIFFLNLSNNSLSGNIPECLGSKELLVLNLGRNKFDGKIPSTIGFGSSLSLGSLELNDNRLEGPIPQSLANCTVLEIIDLGNNKIRDTFPWWLHTLPQLKVLILRSNSFHGSITNHSFTKLQILDISHNNFTGLIPDKFFASLQAIRNMSQGSRDMLYKTYYVNYKYSVTLTVKGVDVELKQMLSIFTTVDISSNNFGGNIPESILSLTSLRLLNLSHNSFHGSIPPQLGRMTMLEQLDLSCNLLSGGIPQTLTNLTFLAVLNLSHNHLVGPIPRGNQFSTFSNDSYVGNSGLCGDPLTRSCGDEHPPPPPGEFEEEEEDGLMMGFTWKTVVIGYGCGVVLGFTLGYVMVSIRKPEWMATFVYTEAAIILERRKKKKTRMVLQRLQVRPFEQPAHRRDSTNFDKSNISGSLESFTQLFSWANSKG